MRIVTFLQFCTICVSQKISESLTGIKLEIDHEWHGGFNAKLTVPILEDIKFGWLLECRFTLPVFSIDIYEAKVITSSSDYKTWLLENQSYNSNLQAGRGFIEMILVVSHKESTTLPGVDFKFHPKILDERIDKALQRIYPDLIQPESDIAHWALGTEPNDELIIANVKKILTSLSKSIDTSNLIPPTRIPAKLLRELEAIKKETKKGFFETNRHNLTQVIDFCLLFLKSQRSGHFKDDRLPWKQSSSLADGSDIGIDLSGGYYQSSGYIKYNFPLSWSLTIEGRRTR